MKLSIIVPCLNEAATIEFTLRPLQAWRGPAQEFALEIIVADGGSSDATVALAQPLVDRVINAPRGRARQMNAGAQAAEGGAYLFLHADTILPEAAPRAILEALCAEEAHVPTVSGTLAIKKHTWGRFDVAISGRHRMLRTVAWCMNLRSRLTGIATGDQAMFMTRAAFDAAGGFPDQPLMEDVELSRRLKRLGPPVCLTDKVATSGRRWEARGVWRTIVLMWCLRFAYFLGVRAEHLVRRY